MKVICIFEFLGIPPAASLTAAVASPAGEHWEKTISNPREKTTFHVGEEEEAGNLKWRRETFSGELKRKILNSSLALSLKLLTLENCSSSLI